MTDMEDMTQDTDLWVSIKIQGWQRERKRGGVRDTLALLEAVLFLRCLLHRLWSCTYTERRYVQYSYRG